MRCTSRPFFVVCPLALLLPISTALAGSVEKGEWTLSQSAVPDRVHFSLQSSDDEGHFNSSSDWPITELRGLDWAASGKHDVHFVVTRDAGTLECEGFVSNAAGAGLFTFRPNPQYAEQMSALGFSGLTTDRQFAFALHDVSLDFARQIKAAGLTDLDIDKLIAFRIHGVSPQFIQDIRAAGLNVIESDKLIAFRIHGVSPEFVKSLRSAGIDTSDPDKLIAFRIHGVSPEFVSDLARLGYPRPEPDKLIALRIHNVTPQYIESLRSRGVQNLTLDQLIALRIHGID